MPRKQPALDDGYVSVTHKNAPELPHGQLSKVLGFAPQIVQVSRSLSAFARAFFSSYSNFFLISSGSIISSFDTASLLSTRVCREVLRTPGGASTVSLKRL